MSLRCTTKLVELLLEVGWNMYSFDAIDLRVYWTCKNIFRQWPMEKVEVEMADPKSNMVLSGNRNLQ